MHDWPMPMELLAADGAEYRRTFLSMGLQTAPGRKAREALTNYIQTARPTLKARCVHKVGWLENIYVFPTDLIELCRPLIKEPNLINDWKSGNYHKSTCTSCNKCEIAIMHEKPLRCYLKD